MADAFTASYRGGSGSPLLCIHGFTDSWRTWELVLPRLEERHDVLAPTLPGHAGGPPFEAGGDAHVDAVEAAMDEAGFETAHLVGNSLGGYVAFKLAERGRARSVVAFAPGGGWPAGDPAAERGEHFSTMHALLQTAAAHADAIVSTPEGRRRATQYTTVEFEHIPPELLAHQIRAAARCEVPTMLATARTRDWNVEPERVTCPVRIVWGTEDKLLPWPEAATRYRDEWFANADWVVLDGVGHLPQLDVPLQTAELVLGFTAR
jgi:pimeloyl-ACP methyl ester carboxylesterase